MFSFRKAKSRDGFGVRAECNKMFRKMSLIARVFLKPFSHSLRNRDRLLARESLASYDEERRLWIA